MNNLLWMRPPGRQTVDVTYISRIHRDPRVR